MAHDIIILNDDLTIYSQGSIQAYAPEIFMASLLADSMSVLLLYCCWPLNQTHQQGRLLLDCGSMIYLLPLKYTKKGTNNLMKVSEWFFSAYIIAVIFILMTNFKSCLILKIILDKQSV